MSNRIRNLSLLTVLALFWALGIVAGENPVLRIKATHISPHIYAINQDTLVLIKGTTMLYTVDTQEGKGLKNTAVPAEELFSEITSSEGILQKYEILDKKGALKEKGEVVDGDRLKVSLRDGKKVSLYQIKIQTAALKGQLKLEQTSVTVNTRKDLVLYFTAGQRSPDVSVKIFLPKGIDASLENTTVNVIGRGDVLLKDLHKQSIGRTGSRCSFSKVGEIAISRTDMGSSVLTFSKLDLRPANGPDLKLVIRNVLLPKTGTYEIKARYTTSQPEVLSSPCMGSETALLKVTQTISDFARIVDRGLQYHETKDYYHKARFNWAPVKIGKVRLLQSLDKGKTWKLATAIFNLPGRAAQTSGLLPDKLYAFKLSVDDGPNKGFSNIAWFYSGKKDVKDFGIAGNPGDDYTEKINKAIEHLHQLGGGTLHFTKGTYPVKTVHLKSNVYLYLDRDATIQALKGADAPEPTWFSDKRYRSGLSPTDMGPYADPENFLTKQDVGHHYFRNAMFFGERLDNIKIIGNGRITGNGNLVTGDKVMNNSPDSRADKMFSLKLCTNVEIGGIHTGEDLWYDQQKDEPHYIRKDGSIRTDISNMLHIDRGGHFVLLATGTDNIHVHNTYFAKNNTSNARDIYDFMACNNVTVTNIYSKVSSDDIVKPGSDCSLGFTRPARHYMVRNIIGDTNCNLFQIGSETADDIMDVHVDNIYVLGANKAGFSISTNDGAHIRDIHLNCGHTGTIHSRSKMFRAAAPFFISISNRGRILGAEAAKYAFTENGDKHNELLVKNVNIGKVENILINGIDVMEVYGGSSFGAADIRWKAFDGSQKRSTPIIAGYKLPDTEMVEGGLDFKLPNGEHTGYVQNISFNDVNVLVKGGNPRSDIERVPPELGVGQYNASNLKVQPSYGLWARHVKNFSLKNSSFNFEESDGRYPVFLDDVIGAAISGIEVVRSKDIDLVIGLKNSTDVNLSNSSYYSGKWGNERLKAPEINQKSGTKLAEIPVSGTESGKR